MLKNNIQLNNQSLRFITDVSKSFVVRSNSFWPHVNCSFRQNSGWNCKINSKCGRPGGGGVFSDFGHPRTRGEGGSKKGKFLRTSFMDDPLFIIALFHLDGRCASRISSKFRPCAWNAWALSARASRLSTYNISPYHACMALRAQHANAALHLRCCLTASGERADNRFDNTSPNQVLTNPARGCFAADARTRKGLWSEQLFNHLLAWRCGPISRWGGSSRAARLARGAAALRQRARQRLAKGSLKMLMRATGHARMLMCTMRLRLWNLLGSARRASLVASPFSVSL